MAGLEGGWEQHLYLAEGLLALRQYWAVASTSIAVRPDQTAITC